MNRVLVDSLVVSDESGFACSKSKLVELGVRHLRPFNIGDDGQLDLSDIYQVPESEAPAKKTRLEAGDILFNNTNSAELVGKAALVPSTMDAGFSNHLTRIRLNANLVEPAYFAFWLRRLRGQGFFTAQATQWVSQAAYKTSELRKVEIVLPTLPEQRRIVDLLSRAEGIVRLRREAEKKAAELIPALFLDTFGDPVRNPKGWPTQRLDQLCNLVRGSSPRPQGDPKYFGGPVPRLMIADITRDGVYVTPTIDSLTIEGAKKSRPMNKGEVVMAVSGAVGLPAILAVDACIHDGFVGFRSLTPSVSPEFFYNYLASFRRHSIGQAVGATFQNLKTDQIREWIVPTPPSSLQVRFQARAKELRGLEGLQAAATAKAQATLGALLSSIFSR